MFAERYYGRKILFRLVIKLWCNDFLIVVDYLYHQESKKIILFKYNKEDPKELTTITGGARKGEEFLDALKREINEETGDWVVEE